MARYREMFHLVEGNEAAARAFCEQMNASATPYQRRRYPATYTRHVIKDNYGAGRDWIGFICWYSYRVS